MTDDSLQPLRVLIADDDADARALLRMVMLMVAGDRAIEIVTAETGAAALEIIGGTEPPGAVIADMRMESWDSGRQVRMAAKSRGIPVLIVSDAEEGQIRKRQLLSAADALRAWLDAARVARGVA